MLLRELKTDQKGTFMDFCIESFRNSFSLFREFLNSKMTKKLKFLMRNLIAKFRYQQIKVISGTALMREFTLLQVSLMWEVITVHKFREKILILPRI